MMFKNIFRPRVIRGLGPIITAFCLALFLSTGCRTGPPLPPANLKEPGWTIRQGQAVWHTAKGQEFAGDVLVGTKGPDRSVVQFTKTPFTLVMAQISDNKWQVEFPPQNRHYSGHGKGPTRVIWFYLPRALSSESLPEKFKWHQDEQSWRLENTGNGEFLEGYFTE
jgi:hypothetical protein